jgi:hypothetical protein
MRVIDPEPFSRYIGSLESNSLGVKPGLAWIPIANLRIDPAYQREVLRQGARNVGKIARKFDWSLFGIVVVASLGDGLFAIVDGQHRTIAAALRSIKEVPCVIIESDPAKQASAFAAINGAVTAISPLSIFYAEIAAGDEKSIAVNQVCQKAGVEICRYPVPSASMKPGQSIAIGTIRKCFNTFGPDLLALALKAIMKSARGKPGLLKESVIKAMCHVLEAEKSFGKPEYRLVSAMERYDLAADVEKVDSELKFKRKAKHAALAELIFDYLEEEMGD